MRRGARLVSERLEMEIASVLFAQCLVMCALMALGLALYRLGLISDGTTKDLGAVLLNVVFPVVILRSFWGAFTPERLSVLGVAFIASTLALILAMAIARLCFPRSGVDEFSAAFSNAGFIGIPLVQATYGEEAVFYIAFFIAELNVLQWTYGRWRISGSLASVTPRSVITSPMLIGLVLGVALFLVRLPVPPIAATIMSTIANLNSPLAMIILGAYLAKSSPRELFGTPRAYAVSLVRLVLVPLATIALFMVIPCPSEVKIAILIAAAAPTGSNVAVFCQQLDQDTNAASNAVCLSTLLSLATVPAVVACASMVL